MTLTVNNIAAKLRSHILFVPGVLAWLGILTAVGLVELDRRVDTETLRAIPWVFGGGASGAREVLSTVANSMIQLAAITFSVTIVVLALRSEQFGPRLLRNFTGDKVNQVILGGFIATFVYCLLVLRAVRDLDDAGIDDETLIPVVSVTFAIVLALMSLAMFVVFIDRVVYSIQASSVIVEAANETHAAVENLFPKDVGEAAPVPPDEQAAGGGAEVAAPSTGYVQEVSAEKLLRDASENDLLVRMEVPIGGFVVKGSALTTVLPAERLDARCTAGCRTPTRSAGTG